jgi:hypothetical protein
MEAMAAPGEAVEILEPAVILVLVLILPELVKEVSVV